MDWDLEISPANIDESKHPKESTQEHVLRLAAEKAGRLIPGAGLADVVIAADTIVVLDEEILGKPSDKREACQMLSQLRACEHWVMTAIAVRFGSTGQVCQDICRTRVQMRNPTRFKIPLFIRWLISVGVFPV